MIEAVRGRLIGPKTWDRIFRIFGAILNSPRTIWECLGCDLFINSCIGLYEARNGHGFRVHKAEPRLDEWAAHGQTTSGFWDY